MTIKKTLILMVLAVTMASCGFHLRGNLPLPDGVKNIVVQSANNRFSDTLESAIKSAGGNIKQQLSEGAVLLKITRQETERTVNTLDDRGKANSYNLILKVSYVLESPDAKVIRQETLQELRRYDFDPALVLETESEEDELIENMEEAIVLRLVRQLSALADYQG